MYACVLVQSVVRTAYPSQHLRVLGSEYATSVRACAEKQRLAPASPCNEYYMLVSLVSCLPCAFYSAIVYAQFAR